MPTQSVLLQIIQFVGLLAPALAILIELLIRFHGGIDELQNTRQIPVEIQVLFLGFGAILIGGMGIGFQMTLTLSNSYTRLASFMIFGGLPLLAISVLMMQVRISSITGQNRNLIEGISLSVKRASSVVIPLVLTCAVFFGILIKGSSIINSELNWWVFHNQIKPIWYFYIIAGFMIYKVMYSLWSHGEIPANRPVEALNHWFVATFTILAMMLLIVAPIFALFYGLIFFNIPYMTPGSALNSIPFIWGSIITIAFFYAEIDPD